MSLPGCVYIETRFANPEASGEYTRDEPPEPERAQHPQYRAGSGRRAERKERKRYEGQGCRTEKQEHRRRLRQAWAAAEKMSLGSEPRVERACESLVTSAEAFLGRWSVFFTAR